MAADDAVVGDPPRTRQAADSAPEPLAPTPLVAAFTVEVESPIRQRREDTPRADTVSSRSRASLRMPWSDLRWLAERCREQPVVGRVPDQRDVRTGEQPGQRRRAGYAASASCSMRPNVPAIAPLRAGISIAQSSAQSKTFLAAVRRQTAGHCQALWQRLPRRDDHTSRRTLATSVDSAICAALHRGGRRSAVVRSMTSTGFRHLCASGRRAANPAPDPQIAQPAHVARLLDECHVATVRFGRFGESVLALIAGSKGSSSRGPDVSGRTPQDFRQRVGLAVEIGVPLDECSASRAEMLPEHRVAGERANRRLPFVWAFREEA